MNLVAEDMRRLRKLRRDFMKLINQTILSMRPDVDGFFIPEKEMNEIGERCGSSRDDLVWLATRSGFEWDSTAKVWLSV